MSFCCNGTAWHSIEGQRCNVCHEFRRLIPTLRKVWQDGIFPTGVLWPCIILHKARMWQGDNGLGGWSQHLWGMWWDSPSCILSPHSFVIASRRLYECFLLYLGCWDGWSIYLGPPYYLCKVWSYLLSRGDWTIYGSCGWVVNPLRNFSYFKSSIDEDEYLHLLLQNVCKSNVKCWMCKLKQNSCFSVF